MATECKGAVLSADVSQKLKPVAEKWADALNMTVGLLHDPSLTIEERREVLTLVMQSAAAVFAPFEPTLVERQNFAMFFHTNLTTICEQYFADKFESQAAR